MGDFDEIHIRGFHGIPGARYGDSFQTYDLGCHHEHFRLDAEGRLHKWMRGEGGFCNEECETRRCLIDREVVISYDHSVDYLLLFEKGVVVKVQQVPLFTGYNKFREKFNPDDFLEK